MFCAAFPVFGVSLAGACLVAYVLIAVRGRRLLLAPRLPERVAGLLLVCSILGAHLAGVLTDHGWTALRAPALLFSSRSPLSSTGGFVGAAVALGLSARVWRLDRRTTLDLTDLAAHAFPFAWLVARAGCALVHDHPGRLSTSPLALAFPDGRRLDCGLLELLATPVLVVLSIALSSHPRAGVLGGSMAVAYSLVRFPLDFLRAADLPGSDPRHAGLTTAQWGALVLFAAGLSLLAHAARQPRSLRASIDPTAKPGALDHGTRQVESPP